MSDMIRICDAILYHWKGEDSRGSEYCIHCGTHYGNLKAFYHDQGVPEPHDEGCVYVLAKNMRFMLQLENERSENNRHDAEELDALHRCLDEAGVPRYEDDLELSAWGRVLRYGDMQSEVVMPFAGESVKELGAEECSDPCPDCGTELVCSPGGGVKCPDVKCGYWFCY